MAVDQKRRQKQLAKKAAKRKEVRAARKASSGGSGAMAHMDRLIESGVMPIHECLAPEELDQSGIGTVFVSRRMPDGDILMSSFLLDVYCLGVKDAFIRVASEMEYTGNLRIAARNEHHKPIDPACARKLVEGAVAYAADLGFAPHPDYRSAKNIFGDIDPDECPTEFTYGKDGKPFYIAGPNENRAKRDKIIGTLERKFGMDGFEYILPVSDRDAMEMGLDLDALFPKGPDEDKD